jgi:hypothetical protein
MLKKVKTKSSAPGRAAVQGSKIEKGDVTSIFSGSDEDSTENSKAFDNPQESRGHNSAEGSKTPEINIPDPGNPGQSGTAFNNPNFGIDTQKITSKPREQMNMRQPDLSERAKNPLSSFDSKDGSISNLSNTNMSKPVIEKYPQANEVARSNSSFPSDFKSEFAPIKNGFQIDSLDQREEAKTQLYQKVTQVSFDKMESSRTEIRTKTEEKISEYTNPEAQADYFTSQAKEAITPNFFKQELSPSNVYSEYTSASGEYGKGQFPQSQDASSTLTQKSADAAHTSSPQRAADSIDSAKGTGQFKGGEPKKFEANLDMSSKEKIMSSSSSSSYSDQNSQTSALASESKSFFTSNFAPIVPTIGGTMSNSSQTTDGAASEVSSNMNI